MDLGDFLRKEDVALRAGVSISGLNRLVNEGAAPPPYRFNRNCTLWSEREVEQWLQTYRKWERRTKKRPIAARAPRG
jgi:predicted DNA-binding transcriptional regulator AlpA